MKDDSTDYALVEPFDCDDIHFTMGVEWFIFRQRLLTGKPFTAIVLDGNCARLMALCERHNRYCEDRPVCDGWREIWVGDEIPGSN